VTIPDIRPNSQDTSAFYLATISQQLAQLNGTQISVPSSLSNPADSFTPPTWAVWVNALWFMSLVISITCAILATLLQQWACRYLRVAYPRYSPHKRARIRAFYRKGVERLHLPWVVEGLPALLHISLFLFFAGLAVFLFSVNRTIFIVVISLVGLCVVVYAYLTILPITHKDSPYSAPLSVLVSFCFTGIRSAFFRLVDKLPDPIPSIVMQLLNRDSRRAHLDGFFSHSMRKTAEQFALQLGPEVDYDSLSWMFGSLDEDKEVEQFFEGVPGLCDSKALPKAQRDFFKRNDNENMLSNALVEFMDRTLSSNLIPDSVKRRRIIICTKAIDAACLLRPYGILRRVLLGNWWKFLGCIEFGLFVQSWKSIAHRVTVFYADCVIAVTISCTKERDDRWSQLASGPLGASNTLLQNSLTQSVNVPLANVIFIVRQTIQTFSGSAERYRSDILSTSSKTLESLRKFDINRTSPELQHEFCGLWNKVIDLAQNDERPHIVRVSLASLKNIRKLYIGLHDGTSAVQAAFLNAADDDVQILDDPNSYCKCTDEEHRPSQPVADLQIEEPAPEVAGIAPPTPDIPLSTGSASHPHNTRPSEHSPLPSPYPRTTAQAPFVSQLTHSSASHVDLQATLSPVSPPSTVPTAAPQGASMALSVPGAANVGASSAPSFRSASSSSLRPTTATGAAVSPAQHV